MKLSIGDMSEFGRARLEDDYQFFDRRAGRGSREDFAEGWMAAMARHRLWSYFTEEARERLDVAQAKGLDITEVRQKKG